MINSIEIKERTWNDYHEKYEIKYELITRDEYDGDFDEFILENIDSIVVRDYAIDELDLVDTDNIPKPGPEDFLTEELEAELEDRGFILFKARSIVEATKLEELKEKMNN